MRQCELFAEALGLTEPWEVVAIDFSPEDRRLDIHIDFVRGSVFPCPVCGDAEAKPYDTAIHTWRHLDFFQHRAYLHARVPRVQCSGGCGIRKFAVPWSRPGSGFTLLFEAFIMTLAREMPVAAIGALVDEYDTRIWRVIHHYVESARRVAVWGLAAFSEDLQAHGGDPLVIEQVCCDMSPAYIQGMDPHFPDAQITFDRFHIMKLMGHAVDPVRREEARETNLLRRTRYHWVKNPEKLTRVQRETLSALSKHNLKTACAYPIRLTLREFFEQPDRRSGEAFLKRWYFWATHSRLAPVIEAAQTIKRHWEGVLNWFTGRLNTGLLEGINSLIQAAKARARGYRTNRNLITMAYLIAGKLEYGLPT